MGAQLLVDLVHVLHHDAHQIIVSGVGGFTVLEEYVAVLMGTAHCRMLRIKRMVTERFYGIHIAHFFEICVIPLFDLLNLVRGTETVKEVDKRNLALDGR